MVSHILNSISKNTKPIERERELEYLHVDIIQWTPSSFKYLSTIVNHVYRSLNLDYLNL
jgi:hypothetical protein